MRINKKIINVVTLFLEDIVIIVGLYYVIWSNRYWF